MIKNNFKWTDELVKEFCNWFTRIPANEVYKKDRFKEFKQSKLQSQDKQVGWEIVEFKTKDGHLAIKQSEPRFGLHWRVMKGESIGWCSYSTCIEDYNIHSVKRLSDGEVFTVSDVFWVYPGHNKHTIKSFHIDGAFLAVLAEDFPKYTYYLPHLLKQPIIHQSSSIDRIEVKSIPNKQDERIEVTNITQWNQTDILNGERYLKVNISDYVPRLDEKFPYIKSAIEQAINGKEEDYLKSSLGTHHISTKDFEEKYGIGISVPSTQQKYYSQSEVDTIRREEQANSEKLRVALDILSRIWYYGNFKIETVNERVLAGIMNELRLFPTTEVEILNRPNIQNYFEKYTNYTPTTQPKEEDKPIIIEDNDRCSICGGEMVYIRGRYPNTDKRKVCPTCTTERLEQISDLCSPEYGKAYQNKN